MKSQLTIRTQRGLAVRLSVLLAVVLLPILLAFSWSAEGHRAVADIAEQVLKQFGNYDAVQALLGNLPLSDIDTDNFPVTGRNKWNISIGVIWQSTFNMERKGSLFPSAHSQARSTIRAASQYLFSLNRPPHCPSRIKLHRASFCHSTLFPLG